MPWTFNPFSGTFDQKGSGGGGGASYIDGEVAVYADLPLDGSAPLNSAWLVRGNSGVWPFNKPAGIYYRSATAGVSRDVDYTFGGTLGDVFADNVFLLYDNSDSTRNLQFDLGSISTGTVRTLTAPNASGRIQIEGQPIGNTTPAAGTFTTLTANNGTLTASAPVLDLAQTWNASGTTFTGFRFNVTNTASAVTSLLADIQLGGTTLFGVNRDGVIGRFNTSTGATRSGIFFNGQSANRVSIVAGDDVVFYLAPNDIGIAGTAQIRWDSTGGSPTGTGTGLALLRDGANHILAQRVGTNAQTFNIYNTFTSATNHERGFLKWSSNVFQIGTEKGSGGGTARALEFQTDGVTRLTIASTGAATFAGGLSSVGINASGGSISTNQALSLSSTSMSCSAIFGTLDITTNAAGLRLYGLGNTSGSATNTERLHISTRSGASYFISTQATGTGTARALEIRTADVARLTFEAAGGLTIADANDIAVGTTTGTKIGTATSQKIGFFNATPVVQQAAVADATDAASTQARLNDLLARLRTLGLIAT
jgi:hypothetical protein